MPNSFHSHRPYPSGLTVVDACSPVFSRPSPRLPTVRLAVKVFSSCGYLSWILYPPWQCGNNWCLHTGVNVARHIVQFLAASSFFFNREGRCFMRSILWLDCIILFCFVFSEERESEVRNFLKHFWERISWLKVRLGIS